MIVLAWLILIVLIAGTGLYLLNAYFRVRNGRAQFIRLPDGAVDQIIKLLELKSGDRLVDLGCGDCKVLIAAYESEPKANYLGVENNPLVVWRARRRVGKRAIEIRRGDLLEADLSSVTHVFVYLGRDLSARIGTKFERELPQGARVVSAQFELGGRAPDRVVELKGSTSMATRAYVYGY